MSRYAEAVAPLVRRIGQESRGWILVQCAPTEEAEVATVLAAGLGWPHVAITDDLDATSSCVITIPRNLAPAVRDTALVTVNGRRDRLSAGAVRVLVVNRGDLIPLQRHAADIVSALRVSEAVPFIPRQLDATETEAAWKQLAAHYRARFGRLDLRGFIRSESEDASFAIEEVFEPLEAIHFVIDESGAGLADGVLSERVETHGRLIDLIRAADSPALVIGGPGAGKSFFLRWCALVALDRRSDLALPEGRWPLPVLVSLSAAGLAPGRPVLYEVAVEGLLSESQLAAHLLMAESLAGRTWFLLDGVDETGDVQRRRATIDAVDELARRFPRSRVIVTTRPTGLDDVDIGEVFRSSRLMISPLSDVAVSSLLSRWCELYEWQRGGTAVAAAAGRATGQQLAREVVSSPPIRSLAQSPLLATIIVIVHRAGLRLPDRRVELYDHVIRILVERWSDLRTGAARGAAPITMPDAVRLLGPVALAMIEDDREGAIDEMSLRALVARSLASGNVRGVDDPDRAVEIFRSSLGLLVEKGPGVYGFLHQTLVEFLAAHELIRTERFVRLAKRSSQAFVPKWREVLLLGAGILGVLQANDERLGHAVQALVASARRRSRHPTEAEPRLLGELLADDPALTATQASAILDALIPRWWFDALGRISFEEPGFLLVTEKLADRIAIGSWGIATCGRLQTTYAQGIESTGAGGLGHRLRVLRALGWFGVEIAPRLCQLFLEFDIERLPFWRAPFDRFERDGAESVGECRLPPGIVELARHTITAGIWRPYWASEAADMVHDARAWKVIDIEPTTAARARVRLRGPPDDRTPTGFMLVGRTSTEARLAVLRAWSELAKLYPDGPAPKVGDDTAS